MREWNLGLGWDGVIGGVSRSFPFLAPDDYQVTMHRVNHTGETGVDTH